MTNKRFFVFFVFFVLILFLYRVAIGNYVVSTFNDTKSYYVSVIGGIGNTFSKYFNQTEHIDKLINENEILKKKSMLLDTFKSKLHKYQNDFYEDLSNPDLEMIKALSYVSLGDMTKFWVSTPNNMNLDENKIYGLIYENSAVGIAKLDGENLKAFLNFDTKCVYAVRIGEENIPGIIFGDGDKMQIKFIPSWLEPKVGDEVRTSGLDDIFYEGVKVGVITSLSQNDVYKSAIVEVENKMAIPNFLYIVKSQKSLR